MRRIKPTARTITTAITAPKTGIVKSLPGAVDIGAGVGVAVSVASRIMVRVTVGVAVSVGEFVKVGVVVGVGVGRAAWM